MKKPIIFLVLDLCTGDVLAEGIMSKQILIKLWENL